MKHKALFFFIMLALCQIGYAADAVIVKSSSDMAIHTYGGGDLLTKVFNAVSMLIYGNDKSSISKTFTAILRIALSIGGFSCVCLAFFREKFEPLLKCFLLPAVGIISVLLVPRTTVIIQDHLTQKVKEINKPALFIVENVPFFLGQFAALVSTVSYQFTQALEGVTHGTDEAMYNWTGHIYAAENIFQAKKCRISNRILEDNFREFCRECAYRDIGIGLYSKDDLVHTKNLLKFLEEKTSNIRTVFYRGNSLNPNEGGFVTCKEAMKKMNQIFHGKEGNTKEIVLGEMGSDIFFLLGQKERGEAAIKNLIKQQIAIDILKEEMPGTLSSFASKRAEILQKENQKILGALGASSIVSMRNFFEALIYVVFPLMIIVALLSFGVKPLISWTQFVLWVNTWPPFYVVVKFLLNSIWEYRRKIAWGESVDLTVFTSEGLYDLYSSMESIAAIAMAFIPFLSWIILKGGVHQMVHMASSLMSPAQSAASTAASEKTTGNYSFGNINMDSLSGYNAQTFKQSYSGQLSTGSVSLDTGRETATYVPESKGLYVRQADSYLREGISRSEAFNSALQKSLSTSESNVWETSRAVSEGVTDTASKAVGLAEAVSKSIQSGKTWNEQESSSFQQSYQYLSGLAQEYGHSKGISKDNALREVLSGGFAGGTSWFSGKLGAKGEAQMSYQDGVSKFETDNNTSKGMETKNFQEHMQTIKNLAKGDVGSILGAEDARLHEDFTQSLSKTESSIEQWRAASSLQNAFSDLKNYSETDNLSINQKLDQRFVEFLSEKFEGDIGKVPDVLDLPSSDLQKRAMIEEFVSDFLPKTVTRDPSFINNEYETSILKSQLLISDEGFKEKVSTLKAEGTQKIGKDFSEIDPEVQKLGDKTHVEFNAKKAEVEAHKGELKYVEPVEKEKSLWAHGQSNMFVPKKLTEFGDVLKSTYNIGAECVRKALFRIDSEEKEGN